MEEKPTKPTHRLRTLNKHTEERGEVGCGWLNDDGSISIRLNQFVVLAQNKDVELRLFIDDWKNRKAILADTAGKD